MSDGGLIAILACAVVLTCVLGWIVIRHDRKERGMVAKGNAVLALVIAYQCAGEFHLGITVSVHRHTSARPVHFHLCLDLGLFFVEFRVGRDQPKETNDGRED